MPFAWRGHTKSLTTRARPSPDLPCGWNNAGGTASVIEALALMAPNNKPHQWNDPDYLMTGGQGCANRSTPGLHCPGQTDVEYTTVRQY